MNLYINQIEEKIKNKIKVEDIKISVGESILDGAVILNYV